MIVSHATWRALFFPASVSDGHESCQAYVSICVCAHLCLLFFECVSYAGAGLSLYTLPLLRADTSRDLFIWQTLFHLSAIMFAKYIFR